MAQKKEEKKEEEKEVVEETVAHEAAKEDNTGKANDIVKKNMLWSLGVGAVPVPVFDLIGITAVQVKMLKEISEVYGKSFSENKVKNIVAALVGSVGSLELAKGFMSSVIKVIPGIGSIAGAITLPITAAAVTFAIGKLFVKHFENGGSFMDFDLGKMKESFSSYFNAGKKEAETLATDAA